jgi:probable rRNA maturation factor
MELKKNVILRSLRSGRLEGCKAVSVEVSVRCDAWLKACPEVEAVAAAAARAALAGAAAPAGAPIILGVVLTGDAEQRRLNRTYRGIDSPTNVLSFAIADPNSLGPANLPLLLGDVVLALGTVEREAAEQRKPLADHLRHLVLHGVLHVLGFDHDDPAAAAAMEAVEVEILEALGVPDPYRDTI